MRLIGRWERVRPIGAHGVGPAFFLDRKWNVLTPVGGDDGWWKSPRGIWRRVGPTLYDQRGAYSASRAGHARPILGVTALLGGPGAVTLALGSAYAHNSAGAAVAVRAARSVTANITDVYAYVSSYTGAAASVPDLNYEIRPDVLGTGLPAATLLASGTVNPASAVGWLRVGTGLGVAVTAGVITWAIVGDANGNATNCATVVAMCNLGTGTFAWSADAIDYRTTGGFASANASNTSVSSVLLAWSDGGISGNAITGFQFGAANLNQRGFMVANGFDGPCKIWGMVSASNAGGLSSAVALRCWLDQSGPTGTPYAASTLSVHYYNAVNAASFGKVFAAPILVGSGRPCRIVFAPVSNNQFPQRWITGSGADAVVRRALPLGQDFYWAESNGTADWSLDDATVFPDACLIVEDLVGAPYPIAGMTGGMRG